MNKLENIKLLTKNGINAYKKFSEKNLFWIASFKMFVNLKEILRIIEEEDEES
jgi:hypothetical protein